MVGGDNHAGWPVYYLIIWLKNQASVLEKTRRYLSLAFMEIGLEIAR